MAGAPSPAAPRQVRGSSRRGESARARKPQRRSRRWLWLAALAGALCALLWQAPASWIAAAVWIASGQRVLLAQPQGTWRAGSALVVLQGGAGSRGATLLPGTLRWHVGLGGLWRARLRCRITWPAVSAQPLQIDAHLGLSRLRLALQPADAAPQSPWQGSLPLAALDGLGTPWNTVALRGQARIMLRGVRLESVAGRLRIDGQVQVDLPDVASRLSVVAPIGSYTLTITGQGAEAQVELRSDKGPLLLQGQGVWNGQSLRFTGSGRAAPGSEAAMANLLSLLGRPEGDHVRIAL